MALRTPGAATCPQTLRPSLGVMPGLGTGQPCQPASAWGLVGSQKEQKQSACTCLFPRGDKKPGLHRGLVHMHPWACLSVSLCSAGVSMSVSDTALSWSPTISSSSASIPG